MAVVSADVERVYLGDKRACSTPTMAAPLPSLFRSLHFRVESAPESIWQDIPIESASSIPPHVHRVVCCQATDLSHAPLLPRRPQPRTARAHLVLQAG
jgi:hypothetical protein